MDDILILEENKCVFLIDCAKFLITINLQNLLQPLFINFCLLSIVGLVFSCGYRDSIFCTVMKVLSHLMLLIRKYFERCVMISCLILIDCLLRLTSLSFLLKFLGCFHLLQSRFILLFIVILESLYLSLVLKRLQLALNFI